jgi:2,3-bisphosphoglycerate-independent phosphoglycerate mutase
MSSMRKYVILIPDGAADSNRDLGGTPLQIAETPGMDYLAKQGVCGTVKTLHEDLPKESMVAQLGILGWDPYKYYPGGRASAELMARHNVRLSGRDIAFRANLVTLKDSRLESYNANYIESNEGASLVSMLDQTLSCNFKDIDIYHLSDFRCGLVLRNANIDSTTLACPEPHENHGSLIDLFHYVTAQSAEANHAAEKINRYICSAAALLTEERSNGLLPWSASRALSLPTFSSVSGFKGKVAIVGFMEFLTGIAMAGHVDFIPVGNGRPDTDYRGKGHAVVNLLEDDYECVVCHINGPDEASHMSELDTKISCIEEIDRHIVSPILRYFQEHKDELGGVMLLPDHYSNTVGPEMITKRSQIHSLDPVPFAIWNDHDHDECSSFSEIGVLNGKHSSDGLTHRDLLPMFLRGL